MAKIILFAISIERAGSLVSIVRVIKPFLISWSTVLIFFEIRKYASHKDALLSFHVFSSWSHFSGKILGNISYSSTNDSVNFLDSRTAILLVVDDEKPPNIGLSPELPKIELINPLAPPLPEPPINFIFFA